MLAFSSDQCKISHPVIEWPYLWIVIKVANTSTLIKVEFYKDVKVGANYDLKVLFPNIVNNPHTPNITSIIITMLIIILYQVSVGKYQNKKKYHI